LLTARRTYSKSTADQPAGLNLAAGTSSSMYMPGFNSAVRGGCGHGTGCASAEGNLSAAPARNDRTVTVGGSQSHRRSPVVWFAADMIAPLARLSRKGAPYPVWRNLSTAIAGVRSRT
jgi:hypothetical protein